MDVRTAPTSSPSRVRSALVLLGVLALVGCTSDAKKVGAKPEPPAVTAVGAPPAAPYAAPTGSSTTDRGDRLERPRPVGALSPEVAPKLP